MAETDPNKLQKFVIKPDGTIVVDWVNPAFTDVILELYPEDEKKKFIEMNEGRLLRIWCG